MKGKIPEYYHVKNSLNLDYPGADLNTGASGNYIYLFTDKDTTLTKGMPIRSISILTSDNPNAACSENRIKLNYNLNAGAKGKYVFICYCTVFYC